MRIYIGLPHSAVRFLQLCVRYQRNIRGVLGGAVGLTALYLLAPFGSWMSGATQEIPAALYLLIMSGRFCFVVWVGWGFLLRWQEGVGSPSRRVHHQVAFLALCSVFALGMMRALFFPIEQSVESAPSEARMIGVWVMMWGVTDCCSGFPVHIKRMWDRVNR